MFVSSLEVWRLNIRSSSYNPSVRSLPEATHEASGHSCRKQSICFCHAPGGMPGWQNRWKHGGARLRCVNYMFWGPFNSDLAFIFDLNYFLWKLKTSKRQGESFFLETKHKDFRFKTKPIILEHRFKMLKVTHDGK